MNRISPPGIFMSILVGFALSGCGASSPQSGAPLQLIEHPLAAAPQPDPLEFQPLQGTQEEALAQHAVERAAGYARTVISVGGNPAIASLGDNTDLLAVLATSAQGQPDQTVSILRGNESIFQTSAGLPSPVLPLQGLWTYEGHWALEILLADQSTWSGQIFIDGELVNAVQGYDEAFGFQLLAEKAFFFYRRDGHIGYSFDGQETDLDYQDIPHYRCCGESGLNPVQARNMVAFFADRANSWFYVELGDFAGERGS
jgi:hypothetical protein